MAPIANTITRSRLADYIATELCDLIETEVIDLSVGGQPDDDEVMDDIAETLDSESYGRVAALVSLAEGVESWLNAEDIAQAHKWRQEALPGRLARNGKRPFTVTGIISEDNGDRWAEVIWADNADEAAHIAGAKTAYAVKVAGVIEGRVEVTVS